MVMTTAKGSVVLLEYKKILDEPAVLKNKHFLYNPFYFLKNLKQKLFLKKL